MTNPQTLCVLHLCSSAALLVPVTVACVGDIDFDEIAPACQEPQLDSPRRDEFCSGEFGSATMAIAAPEGQQIGHVTRADDDVYLVAGELRSDVDNVFSIYDGLTVARVNASDALSSPSFASLSQRSFPGSALVTDVYPLHPRRGLVAVQTFDQRIVFLELETESEATTATTETRLPPGRIDPETGEPDDLAFNDLIHVVLQAGEDLTSQGFGEEIVLALAVFDYGVKPFFFGELNDTWIELVPPFQWQPGQRNEYLASLGPDYRACFMRGCSGLPDNATRCDALDQCFFIQFPESFYVSALILPPSEFANANDIDVNERDHRMYFGGIGFVRLLDGNGLGFFDDDKNEADTLERQDQFQLGSTTGESINSVTVAIEYHDGHLYVLTIPFDEEAIITGQNRPTLHVIELDEEGNMTTLAAMVSLPREFVGSVFYEMAFLDEENVAVLRARGGPVVDIAPDEPSTLVLVDILDPTSPAVIATDSIEPEITNLHGFASVGSDILFPGRGGILRRSISLRGDFVRR